MPPKVDVRRLLKKQQLERTKKDKVNHPFAKYDEAGRLICVVCNSTVKSESVWQAHLGSASHRDNIQKLKALKQQQQLKRPAPSNTIEQNKRIKVEEDEQNIESSDDDVSLEDEDMGLPADFFDEAPPSQTENIEQVTEETTETGLPAGFFDDPEEEAKVQGSVDPVEKAKIDLQKDLEEFNEAMAEVTQESRQVQDEDDELFWQERHLEINREQDEFDSRVEKLKQLRQSGGSNMALDQKEQNQQDDEIKLELKSSVRQLLKNKSVKQQESMFLDDDMEESDDEEEDWRSLQL